jgi:tetratricopeptide (TPR) repeat protein
VLFPGRLTALLAVPLLAAAVPFADVRADRDDPEPAVRDLAYGEVLFHYFQDEHFSALTRLLAGLSRDELPSHARDADLLLGALYLSYGQHRIAGQIFDQILEDAVDVEVRDRVWYFLAKVWHQRGYLPESEQALARIQSELPDELEPERIMLHAQVLMELGRFDDALAALEAWRRPQEEWVGYSKYNIGVALVRLGRVEDGAKVLDQVSRLDPENVQLDALRDKANVALGYAWLQSESPELAREPLQRVRLTGPFSNKALLGVGWADAELENYQAALAPWLALRGRNLLDSAVQESYLAVPYAFSQLGADKQAADYYVDAIEAYNSEISRLQSTIESIHDGELIVDLLADQEADGSGWFWRLDDVPDSAASRYLYELMATHRFQEALKSYRDVLHLNQNLDQWAESLTAFDDILDTKQRAYETRLPVVEESLKRMDLAAMAEYRLTLESRLGEIEARDNAAAMGVI